MAKKPRVLDSWAMLAFFQNEPAADQKEIEGVRRCDKLPDLVSAIIAAEEMIA